MAKTTERWCKKCDRMVPHDRVKTLDGYSGHGALWLDHILFRSEVEEVWKCQRCSTKTTAKKY